MLMVFGKKLKVIGFKHKGVISVLMHEEMNESVKLIGDDYRSIEEAIDAGEKAWIDSGKTLNYRIESLDGDEIMIRYADMEYGVGLEDHNLAYRISSKMQSFDYIREYYSE